MATVVEILRVANGVVLESERLRLRRAVQALTFAQYLPDDSAQPPPAVALVAADVNAGVLFVHRNARRRHAAAEVRRPSVNNIAHFFC